MKKRKIKFRFAPLNGAYMATSILGLMISIMYVFPQSYDWGLSFTLIFVLMFIASIISMTVADPDSFIELEKDFNKK